MHIHWGYLYIIQWLPLYYTMVTFILYKGYLYIIQWLSLYYTMVTFILYKSKIYNIGRKMQEYIFLSLQTIIDFIPVIARESTT